MHDATQRIMDRVIQLDSNQTEFIQAVTSFLNSVDKLVDDIPQLIYHKVLDRIVEPERAIIFRVPWVDDDGQMQLNRAFRVQMNSALGPYKGGMRFHPSVNLSILKFLAFEQTFKNSLTGLALGGGKGGSDFNPKGKSDGEVMRFCQSLMIELGRHIGEDTDVPAGDIGVGGREIGYMYGQYKRLYNKSVGILTGKHPSFGGSYIRPEATGYGLVYLSAAMLDAEGKNLQDKSCLVSGSGNVAQFTTEKLLKMGAKVLTMSDSSGVLIDPSGIDEEKLAFIKTLKNVRRGRIAEYAQKYKEATYIAHNGSATSNPLWDVKADYAFPCATQNEINTEDAKHLVANGIQLVGEGANMPTTLDAEQILMDNGVLLAPGKASNAGGVAVSGLEMVQNSQRLQWTPAQVDAQLLTIMKNIYSNISSAAEKYSTKNNFVDGANIAGFIKISDAMLAQGYV
ncbi:NADP-specific glutamate dehydrogenase [Sphaerochaeta sp. PS]|uniref:NADP-specific glutamate dehydrogenase n=1 Tax=Sphaerochaeta sp. PS TaxID=3076336 RepID=UPI0028A34695|nr:NADP-specific glutamate dehydrogenase [Sphaerochaeta sp. PS]MDT4762395.1 NADP-specific glutamate dehydrogenase [Sphaerochaeta sp. PS]